MNVRRLGIIAFASGLALTFSLLACSQPATAPPPKSTTPATTKPTTSPTVKPTATTAASPVSFAGKTIAIVVPTSAGGSTDIFARLYARYLTSFLPGKPTIIVKTMPGGASTIGGNYAYTAKPDGTTLLASTVGVHVAQLLGISAVQYDLVKMTALIGTPAGALYYMKSGIVSTPEDVTKAKGIIFGYSSGTSAGTILFLIAKESMNIPTDRVVVGYGSSGDARRAFLSGETNFSYETSGGYQEALVPYVEKGQVMLVFQTGLVDEKGDIVKDPNMPPIPTYKELYQKIMG